MPMRMKNGLTHTSWFNGLGKRVFGYYVNLFRSEDLVHRMCGHVVCARGEFKGGMRIMGDGRVEVGQGGKSRG